MMACFKRYLDPQSSYQKKKVRPPLAKLSGSAHERGAQWLSGIVLELISMGCWFIRKYLDMIEQLLTGV